MLEGPTPERPDRTVPPVPDTPTQYIEGGSAEDNFPFFAEQVREYAQGEAPILGQQITEALAEEGFETGDMQVSFDRTKTDLPADSIFFSVRFGADCLIGQLVPDSRDFQVELAAAVGPEDNICLIGETREIVW